MKYVLRLIDSNKPNKVQYWETGSWQFRVTDNIRRARSWKTKRGASTFWSYRQNNKALSSITGSVEEVLQKSDFPVAYVILKEPSQVIAVILNDKVKADEVFHNLLSSTGTPAAYKMEELIANKLP